VILQSFGVIRIHSPHDNALDRRGPHPNALWHRCSAEVSTPLGKQATTPAPFGCMRSAGQSRARSREPGESALWHRCRHVELNVQIRPPSGLKADWGRPPRGQYANWYANQPDSGGVRGCTPTYAKRSDLQKLDTHEHRRTHCLNLGVKWSQVQILSARPMSARPMSARPMSARPMSARPRSHGFTCGYSFHEVASWDRLGPIWDQYSNRCSNPQRLRPPRWTSQMVNATEATTAIMSRIWVVIALIYR
jgi:hypothetical protein